jgi:glycosyltransferase involved in cell wall biosynthesis
MTSRTVPAPLKLYYAAGPGDVVGTFRHWLAGRRDPRQYAVTYSEQFFAVAAELGAEARVVSRHSRTDAATERGIEVVNRPESSSRYWANQLVEGLRLLRDLLTWRPDVAVVAEGTCPWFLLWPARAAGIRIVPSMHCVLWPPARRPGARKRLGLALEGWTLGRMCPSILSASELVSRQIMALAPRGGRILPFLPTYRAEDVAPANRFPARPPETRCRWLFAGRVESDKGIFDLLAALEILERERPGFHELDVCGTGSALDKVATMITALGWTDRVRLHGHCTADRMAERFSACDLVVVPTTGGFVEGFNQVVAEGVLAGKPVIATDVCPSAHLFGEAVRRVAPDRPEELAAAIRDVAGDPALYARMAAATRHGRSDLFSPDRSWGQALREALRASLPGLLDGPEGAIGYLVPQFPSETHAFFWRELSAMRDAGARVAVLSTRPPKPGTCRHEFAAGARRETWDLNRPDVGVLALLLARPRRLAGALGYLLSLPESTAAEKIKLLALLPCAARLVILARRLRLHHIHLHSCADAAHVGALAHLLGGVPYSLTLHGDLPVYGKDHREKFARAAFVSAVTRPLQEQIATRTGIPVSRVPVIWMGVDTDRFVPSPDRAERGDLRILTVARLIPQKGHHDALAALAQARLEGIAVRYVIAGSGPFEAEIRKEVDRLGLGDVVEMAGSASEAGVRALLAEADVFLLPSYGLGEAAPVSVMEAMACGLPVICSRIGGTPDMIRHGENGWLTEQRAPDQLAGAFRALAGDRALRERLGRAARQAAEAEFDHRVNARKLLSWIRGKHAVPASAPTPEPEPAPLPAPPRPRFPRPAPDGPILLVMEQCNPLWPSVPRVAYEIFRHLRDLTPVTLVTHERNRQGLSEAFPDADIRYVPESAAVRRYYAMVSRFVGGRGTNWPLLHAFGYPVYEEFDRRASALFTPAVRQGQFRAVLATTPILPRYPYAISAACTEVPFLLGPVNGGLPFPPGFGKVALQEGAAFNGLRDLCRLIPGYTDTYRRADRVFAGSRHTLEWIAKVFPEIRPRLRWLPENAVSTRFFAGPVRCPDPGAPLRLLFAGRLVPYKGADILLDALRLALPRMPGGARLRVVGDGPMRPRLEEQARALGIHGAIEFAGPLPPAEMPDVFQAADLFCFPSIREFGGAVVLEAMASGVPCIVPDHGGIGEYVTPECGIKVTPRSREHLVAAFAEALVRLGTDRAELARLAAASRKRALEFTWEEKARLLVAAVTEAELERGAPRHRAAA